MPFSLLVQDSSEPRQTEMDIWKKSGSRLSALLPAIKTLHAHLRVCTHTNQPSLVSAIQRL